MQMEPEAFIEKDLNPNKATPTKKLAIAEPDEHYSLGQG